MDPRATPGGRRPPEVLDRAAMSNHQVKDLKFADAGRLRIEWAESRMPVLMALRERHRQTKPFAGARIAG